MLITSISRSFLVHCCQRLRLITGNKIKHFNYSHLPHFCAIILSFTEFSFGFQEEKNKLQMIAIGKMCQLWLTMWVTYDTYRFSLAVWLIVSVGVGLNSVRFLWIDIGQKHVKLTTTKENTNTRRKTSFEISFLVCVCVPVFFSSFLKQQLSNSKILFKFSALDITLQNNDIIRVYLQIKYDSTWREEIVCKPFILSIEKKNNDCLTIKTNSISTWMCTQFMIHLINVLFLNKNVFTSKNVLKKHTYPAQIFLSL